MHDDDYLRTLEGILTDQDPTGIDPDDPYGQADDGIDRYDGFGREVRVESLSVGHGQHGSELVVAFVLVLNAPGLEQVPARGEVRLPFDPEWRRLSGYADPAGYAPQVAARVMSAAHLHVQRHRRGRDEVEAARDQVRASLPRREVQWRMLLDALGRRGRTEELSPGRLRVHLEHPDAGTGERRVLTVVVTPEQWEHVLATRAGDDPDLYLDELLDPRDEDEDVVVFYDGDLVRSTREQLPPVRGRALERKLAEYRVDRDATYGWFATRPGSS